MTNLIGLAYYVVTHAKALRLGVDKIEENLLVSLIKATGECVEDNANLTCNWGKTQRILNVFQGYIPNIQITASLEVETPDVFQRRVSAIISDYLSNLEESNALRLVVCCESLPSTIDRDDIKMSFRRIINGWKEHANFVYRGRQLDGVLVYLDRLLDSYVQMVDDCDTEVVDGTQQASFILGVSTATKII